MEDLTQRIAEVRDDREHGSRWLVRQTILLLHKLAVETTVTPEERLQRVLQAGHELAHARPAMAALAGAVGRILAASPDLTKIAEVATQVLRDYDQAIPRITAFARPYLGETVLTHSLSGTVLAVLQGCIPPVKHVIILEGRPLYEGRTLALSLAEQPLKRTIITDAQADIFLPLCQAVVVGADSILADGSILNKAGTALLAWAAHGHGIPLYVLSETLKISPRSWSGDPSFLEEHASSEVWSDLPPGIAVRNCYFDHTPAHLVTGIITELGPLNCAEIADQARKIKIDR